VVALVDESNGELGSDWEVGVRCGVEDDLGEDIMRFGCTYFVTSWLFSHPPPPLRTTPMSLAKNPLRIFGFSSRKKEEEEIGEKKKELWTKSAQSLFFSLSLSRISLFFSVRRFSSSQFTRIYSTYKKLSSLYKNNNIPYNYQKHQSSKPATPQYR